MKQISEEEIKKIGQLAAIALSEEERKAAAEMLDNLLSGFDLLRELDTDGMGSEERISAAFDAVREDEKEKNGNTVWNRKLAINNAPDFSDGVFIVPETRQ